MSIIRVHYCGFMNDENHQKDLLVLFAIVSFIVIVFVSLKMYDMRTGKIGDYGARLYQTVHK